MLWLHTLPLPGVLWAQGRDSTYFWVLAWGLRGSFPAGSSGRQGLTLAQRHLSSAQCTAPRSPQGKVPLSRAFPGLLPLLPARLGEDDYGPTAALEGGLHGAHGGGFCGVTGNRRQAAKLLK